MTTMNAIINEALTEVTGINPIVEEARDLADRLDRLSSQTSQVKTIRKICSAEYPDLNELRSALLEQCRETTAAKQAHSGRSESVLADFADRCFDLAMRC